MKMSQRTFNHKDISAVLFANAAPRAIIYPFWKSSIERLSTMDFSISLSSKTLEDPTNRAHTKLAHTIVAIRNLPVNPVELQSYFSIATTPLVNLMFFQVAAKYLLWKEYFIKNLSDFVKKPESKFQWEIAQSIGISAVMQSPFSFEQKMWIAYASSTNRNDEKKFMMDVVDHLKPWINNELFQYVEKVRESKKENIDFTQQKKKMLEGSFGMSESDTVAIKRVEQEMSDRHMQEAESTLDIIR